jgi:hypothetical protein
LGQCANGHAAPVLFGARGFFGVYPTDPSPGCLRGISEAAFVPCSIIKTAIRPIRYSKCSAGPCWRSGVFGGCPTSPLPGCLHSIGEAAFAHACTDKTPVRGTRYGRESVVWWQHGAPGVWVSEAMGRLAAKPGFRRAFEGAGTAKPPGSLPGRPSLVIGDPEGIRGVLAQTRLVT